MKKILTILGARPQFIKSKPLSRAIKKHKGFKEIIVHTGQHYDSDMYLRFLKELKLPKPNYLLNINRTDNIMQVKRMSKRLTGIINKEKPDIVLVYGDTNSTLAGAIAADTVGVALAHVEAGLRSYRKAMAEERNRVATDRISSLLFAPVQEAVDNLKKERISNGVHFVGDVLYDLLLESQKDIDSEFKKLKNKLFPPKKDYILATIHRAELVDSKRLLERALRSLSQLDKRIVLPLHPRTAKNIKHFGFKKYLNNILCIKPQTYMQTLALIKNADTVVTDSGGVQREAYMLKVPCITLRNETEWNGTTESGWNIIVRPRIATVEALVKAIKKLKTPSRYKLIFGKGNAAEKILLITEKFLKGKAV